MAKQRHNTSPPETSSKGTLVMLGVGALLVAGLVVWALTRTVDTGSNAPSVMDTVATANTPAPSAPTATVETPGFTPPVTTASSASDFTTAASPNFVPPRDITTSTQAPERAEVQRISAEDLRERMKSGNVVVVDVRDANSFEGSHIPGSINIPMASIESNLDQLPKNKEIVAYCT